MLSKILLKYKTILQTSLSFFEFIFLCFWLLLTLFHFIYLQWVLNNDKTFIFTSSSKRALTNWIWHYSLILIVTSKYGSWTYFSNSEGLQTLTPQILYLEWINPIHYACVDQIQTMANHVWLLQQSYH